MSVNPFTADPDVPSRLAAIEAARGDAIWAGLAEAFGRNSRDPVYNLGGVLSAADAASICAENGLAPDELMLLSLGLARTFARPPVSHFTVGAIGREAGTGNLVFGGNLEFPGAPIGHTVHAEGFVFARAFSRGTAIETLALGEAHPCAHCRQFLSEFAATAQLTLIDPLGHRLTMAELYPWPFDPAYLGERGIVAGEPRHPTLQLAANDLPPATAACLIEAGRRAHVPYGKGPAAIVLTLHDGSLISGAAIESVAFNPSLSPAQAVMIDLFAHGYAVHDIASGVIAGDPNAPVEYILSSFQAFGGIAPNVKFSLATWA